jgi:hypothetical protein
MHVCVCVCELCRGPRARTQHCVDPNLSTELASVRRMCPCSGSCQLELVSMYTNLFCPLLDPFASRAFASVLHPNSLLWFENSVSGDCFPVVVCKPCHSYLCESTGTGKPSMPFVQEETRRGFEHCDMVLARMKIVRPAPPNFAAVMPFYTSARAPLRRAPSSPGCPVFFYSCSAARSAAFYFKKKISFCSVVDFSGLFFIWAIYSPATCCTC